MYFKMELLAAYLWNQFPTWDIHVPPELSCKGNFQGSSIRCSSYRFQLPNNRKAAWNSKCAGTSCAFSNCAAAGPRLATKEHDRHEVEQLMSPRVKACAPQDTRNRAAQIMWDFRCGRVPVVDGDHKRSGSSPTAIFAWPLLPRELCFTGWRWNRQWRADL